MEYIFDLKPYELDIHQIKKYYGSDDINLKTIEKYFKVSINANSETLSFSCDEKTKDLIFKVLILMIDSLDDIDINNIINNVCRYRKNFPCCCLCNKYVKTKESK